MAPALLWPPVTDAAAPADYRLDIELRFLGMTVGEVEISASNGDEGLAQDFALETVGLVRDWTGFRSRAAALARFEAGAATTVAFDTSSENERATRDVVVRYDDKGNVVELESLKRDRPDPSKVPPDLRHQTIDPLTALQATRAWLAEVREAGVGETVFPVFDGRRRYDVVVTLKERRLATFGDGNTPILDVELRLRPIAGFDDGDGDERVVTALVSDDDAVLPLILRTSVGRGLQAAAYTRRACLGEADTSCREFDF